MSLLDAQRYAMPRQAEEMPASSQSGRRERTVMASQLWHTQHCTNNRRLRGEHGGTVVYEVRHITGVNSHIYVQCHSRLDAAARR